MKVVLRRKSVVLFAAGAVLFGSALIHAEDTAVPPPTTIEERLQALEQRNAILERKYENDQDAAAAKANEGASVTAGKDGFAIKSNDGNFLLRIGGYIQTDYRTFLNDVNQTGTTQFLVRRARLILEGTVNKFVDFRFMPDFGGGTTVLYDAYADIKGKPWLTLRAGKFKPSVGIEQLQSDASLIFVERGLPNGLVPNRDVGTQLFGDIAGGVVSYAAGVFDGTSDGASADGDTNDEKEYAGRIFLQPFKATSVEALREFGFGISGTNGPNHGSATTPSLASYKTDGQQTFYTYSANVYANGTRARLSPQGYWYAGPFGLLGEYVVSSQELSRTAAPNTKVKLIDTAWQIAASYVVTGEKATYKGVKPRHSVGEKGLGAWELAFRYEQFRADPDAFSLYADPAKSAAKALSWTGGVNWYLTSNLKAVGNYVNTRFSQGGAGNTDRPREEAILTRLQIVF